MEVIILCATITMIMAVLLVGIGVALARMDKDDCKRELDGDTNSNVHVCGRCRDRECDNGYDKPNEVIQVLSTIRTGASRTEKEALDYAIESVIVREKVERFLRKETEKC